MRGWYKKWRDRWRSALGDKGKGAAMKNEQMVVGSEDAEGMRQYVAKEQTGEEMESASTVICDHGALQDEAEYIQHGDTPSPDSGDFKETWEETAAAVHGDKAGDKGKRLNPRVIELKIRAAEEEYMQAVERCNKALADWRIALHRLDWVHEPDQIDYAIYSVIAAEKHYATTLKETKRLYRQLDDMRKQRFA
jgi:hypothetical protein